MLDPPVGPTVNTPAPPPVVLLGSAATSWPEPGCGCRACRAAVDTVAPAALRVGGTVGGITVRGARIALAEADPTGDRSVDSESVGGGVGAAVVDVAVGDAVELGGVRVIGLPATSGGAGSGTSEGAGLEPALVIASPRTGTVLWAPGPGPLPASTMVALEGAALDVVVLGTGQDGEPLARSLALLRRAGALADGCDVVAVGLDHRTGHDRLASLLPRWGARLVPDGAPLGRGVAAPAERPPHRTLVLGPASSGKSALAEALLAAEPDVDYLPTGPAPSPDDTDWSARVARHRSRRPPWWRTLDGASPVAALAATGPPLLLDSVGTWVSGALDRAGAWNDAPQWHEVFDAEVDAVVGAWRRTGRQVVAVGEETGWGVVPATPAGRRFRDALGTLNRRLAAESEQVLLVVAGRVTPLQEGLPGA